MTTSAWLVGSIYLDAGTILVNTNPVEIAAGNYYLRHSNATYSLVDYILGRLQTEEPTVDMYVTEGRTVRIFPDGVNAVAVDWQSMTALRDLLGYTGVLASSVNPHDAPNVSPLLWSPGFPATPATVLGTPGQPTRDASRMMSADGTEFSVTTYFTQNVQTLAWSHIAASRMRVAEGTDGGGTFHEWHEQSAALGYRFRYYEQQTEVDSSTTEVTWDDTADNSFGPYVLRQDIPGAYRRAVSHVDLYSPLTLPIVEMNAEYP